MTRIFHITTREQALLAWQAGEYSPETLAEGGFVHCSTIDQVLEVANLRFADQSGLVLLEIDPSQLGGVVVEENLEGGEELYPHIYGRLPMSAVSAVHDFPRNGSGSFDLPEVLR